MCQRTSMRQYTSSPRKEKTGHERYKERDYKGLRRVQVAYPVWPAHQLRRLLGGTSVLGPNVVDPMDPRRASLEELEGNMSG